jgi:hypothetical protein
MGYSFLVPGRKIFEFDKSTEPVNRRMIIHGMGRIPSCEDGFPPENSKPDALAPACRFSG